MININDLFAEFAEFYYNYYSFLNGGKSLITQEIYIDTINQYIEKLRIIVIKDGIDLLEFLPKCFIEKHFSSVNLILDYILNYEINVNVSTNHQAILKETANICLLHLSENSFKKDDYFIRALCFHILDSILDIFTSFPDKYFISVCDDIALVCSQELVFNNPINKCLIFFYMIKNEETIFLLEKYAVSENLDIQDNAKEFLENLKEDM